MSARELPQARCNVDRQHAGHSGQNLRARRQPAE
jgi:hypothetical protein